MRDLQRLERLSDSAALGLWADDVVVALHHARISAPPQAAEKALLASAAEVLDAALQQAEEPSAAPRAARGLIATTTARSLAASLAKGSGDDDSELLRAMASVLRAAAEGSLFEDSGAEVDMVTRLFAMLGEHQLVESSSVLSSRKDASTWTATTSTSSFS